MREIKFRGQRKDNRKWIIGCYCNLAGLAYIADYPVGSGYDLDGTKRIGRWVEVIPSTVGEFIGKEDCKGQEIYEWDKVRGTIDGESHEWMIEWEEADDYTGWPIGEDNWPFEVIGNIHETPAD